jgi:hypothetical protein
MKTIIPFILLIFSLSLSAEANPDSAKAKEPMKKKAPANFLNPTELPEAVVPEETKQTPAQTDQGEAKFYATLLVRTDTGDKLPVWVNGKRVGTTPYRTDQAEVGTYIVSFLDPALIDTILQNPNQNYDRLTLPSEIDEKFKDASFSKKHIFVNLAQYARQAVVLKRDEKKLVIFEAGTVYKNIGESKRSLFLAAGLGSVAALIVFFAIYQFL